MKILAFLLIVLFLGACAPEVDQEVGVISIDFISDGLGGIESKVSLSDVWQGGRVGSTGGDGLRVAHNIKLIEKNDNFDGDVYVGLGMDDTIFLALSLELGVTVDVVIKRDGSVVFEKQIEAVGGDRDRKGIQFYLVNPRE